MDEDTDFAAQVMWAVTQLNKTDSAAAFLLEMFARSQMEPKGMTVHDADRLADWGRVLTSLGAAATAAADRRYGDA
jgi:hypothetical protein